MSQLNGHNVLDTLRYFEVPHVLSDGGRVFHAHPVQLVGLQVALEVWST